MNNQSKPQARRTLAKVDSVGRVTLYPEGYPEQRTFVSNGILMKCSSYKEVSVVIRERSCCWLWSYSSQIGEAILEPDGSETT